VSMVEMVEITSSISDGGLLAPTTGRLNVAPWTAADVLQDGMGVMRNNPLVGAQLLTVAQLQECAGTILASVVQSLPADSAVVVCRALAQRDAEIRESATKIQERDSTIHDRDAEILALKRENVQLRRQIEPDTLACAESSVSLPAVLVPVVKVEQLWDEYRDQEGCIYYHNRVTGETTWTKPE
jgi:hypothetical protein